MRHAPRAPPAPGCSVADLVRKADAAGVPLLDERVDVRVVDGVRVRAGAKRGRRELRGERPAVRAVGGRREGPHTQHGGRAAGVRHAHGRSSDRAVAVAELHALGHARLFRHEAAAYVVVALELLSIGYIRYRYFKLSFWFSIAQVVFGGALVFLAGVLIGSA